MSKIGRYIGMMLAASGLYALVSFTVSQRTREIGIRTALGAAATDIIFTIARRALIQVTIGVALGSILGWWALEDELLSMADAHQIIAGVALAVIVLAALLLPVADSAGAEDSADGGVVGGVGGVPSLERASAARLDSADGR